MFISVDSHRENCKVKWNYQELSVYYLMIIDTREILTYVIVIHFIYIFDFLFALDLGPIVVQQFHYSFINGVLFLQRGAAILF